MAEMLHKNRSITELNFSDNQIGDVGAKMIAEALKTNNTLTHLSLASNQIGNMGAIAIAKALEKNHTLKDIDLACNQISDLGVQMIMNALQSNQSLVNINFRCNKIGKNIKEKMLAISNGEKAKLRLYCTDSAIDIGANAIAEALKVNRVLKNIDISNNQIGDVGANAIITSLKYNLAILDINVDNNKINTEKMHIIKNMIKKHDGLRYECANAGQQDIWIQLQHLFWRTINLIYTALGFVETENVNHDLIKQLLKLTFFI